MLTNHTVYKYETPYRGPFVMTQCFTNGTVMLQYGVTQNQYNIRRIKPYKSDAKVEYPNSINMYDYVNILSPVIYFCLNIKDWIQSM